jgi:hypothetical protein
VRTRRPVSLQALPGSPVLLRAVQQPCRSFAGPDPAVTRHRSCHRLGACVRATAIWKVVDLLRVLDR